MLALTWQTILDIFFFGFFPYFFSFLAGLELQDPTQSARVQSIRGPSIDAESSKVNWSVQTTEKKKKGWEKLVKSLSSKSQRRWSEYSGEGNRSIMFAYQENNYIYSFNIQKVNLKIHLKTPWNSIRNKSKDWDYFSILLNTNKI